MTPANAIEDLERWAYDVCGHGYIISETISETCQIFHKVQAEQIKAVVIFESDADLLRIDDLDGVVIRELQDLHDLMADPITRKYA